MDIIYQLILCYIPLPIDGVIDFFWDSFYERQKFHYLLPNCDQLSPVLASYYDKNGHYLPINCILLPNQ